MYNADGKNYAFGSVHVSTLNNLDSYFLCTCQKKWYLLPLSTYFKIKKLDRLANLCNDW